MKEMRERERETDGESDDGGGESEESVLGHSLGESDKGICDPEHDSPQEGTGYHASDAEQDEVVPAEEGLHLKPHHSAVPPERRGGGGDRLLEEHLPDDAGIELRLGRSSAGLDGEEAEAEPGRQGAAEIGIGGSEAVGW